MKNPPRNCIAISRPFLCLVAMCLATGALAGTAVGTVTQVNGPLLLQRADGALKAIALHSFVEQGDVLVTDKSTYAQLRFADDSEVTLKPNTRFKIEALVFNAGVAENADTVFSLAQGAVEIRTGGAARARPENIKLVIPSVREPVASAAMDRKAGTTFVAQFIAAQESRFAQSDAKPWAVRYPAILLAAAQSPYRSDAPAFSVPSQWNDPYQLAQIAPGSGGGLAPGLYVHVIDGLIQLSNRGGVQQFAAGQFGFTGSVVQPPVIVPKNPGIQFNPPPAFQSSTGPQSNSGSSSKPKTVDCEVR